MKNSLYHQYICLSKKHCNHRNAEGNYDGDDIEKWLAADTSTSDAINDFILDDVLRNTLTEREFSCIKLIVIDGYSSTQAAKLLGIARQTANEAKMRALGKLKTYFRWHN